MVQVQQILVDMHTLRQLVPIPEGNVTAKAYNHDESKVSTSDPKFATDTIPPTTQD